MTSQSEQKPKVIGIYGLPGSGKTTLRKILEYRHALEHIKLFEGSESLQDVLPPDVRLSVMDEDEKIHYRKEAIERIRDECRKTASQTAIVTGHALFWAAGEECPEKIMTASDLSIYTHIIFLRVQPKNILQQRKLDTKRTDRPEVSVKHLQTWQDAEIRELHEQCRKNKILFTVVDRSQLEASGIDIFQRFEEIILYFANNDPSKHLDNVMAYIRNKTTALSDNTPKHILVFDGDKTLAPMDTGKSFWSTIAATHSRSPVSRGAPDPLKDIFSGPMEYSIKAFEQAMLRYEVIDDDVYTRTCEQVAASVAIHPQFVSLIQAMAQSADCKVVLITCGIRDVWAAVLKSHGLNDKVTLIAGNKFRHGYVVTPIMKRILVLDFQKNGHKVSAFGDSELDLMMLEVADKAFVAVPSSDVRSESMSERVAEHCKAGLLKNAAKIVLQNEQADDGIDLPAVRINDPATLTATLQDKLDLQAIATPASSVTVIHATDTPASKLLATATRDSSNNGPALRKAHFEVGRYLATRYLTSLVGLSTYPISHVNAGTPSFGHRLQHEEMTLIIPLMRGGEPMALGISEVFPKAAFFHAKQPEDLTAKVLDPHVTLILVDSVINTGRSSREFVEHVRRVHAHIRIVVVAGVVQSELLGERGDDVPMLGGFGDVSLVALRVSGNKYVGKGGSDTGARLFNSVRFE